MKYFALFSILAVLGLPLSACASGVVPTAGPSAGAPKAFGMDSRSDAKPASAPADASVDTGAPDAQTSRVVSNPFMRDVVRSAQKHYRVKCRVPSVKAADAFIKWTCLNNMSCTYKLTIPCFATRAPFPESLDITVSGFDDGQNQVESIKLTSVDQ